VSQTSKINVIWITVNGTKDCENKAKPKSIGKLLGLAEVVTGNERKSAWVLTFLLELCFHQPIQSSRRHS